MFEDDAFQVDEDDYDYKQLNPVKSARETSEGAAKRIRALTAAEESDEERIAARDGKSNYSDESDSESESESDEGNSERDQDMSEKEKKAIAKQVAVVKRRREAKEKEQKFMNELTVGQIESREQDAINMTFDKKVKQLNKEIGSSRSKDAIVRKNHRGEAELTFVPKKAPQKKKKVKFENNSDGDDDDETAKVDNGRTKPRFDGRRRASKNVFRGM